MKKIITLLCIFGSIAVNAANFMPSEDVQKPMLGEPSVPTSLNYRMQYSKNCDNPINHQFQNGIDVWIIGSIDEIKTTIHQGNEDNFLNYFNIGTTVEALFSDIIQKANNNFEALGNKKFNFPELGFGINITQNNIILSTIDSNLKVQKLTNAIFSKEEINEALEAILDNFINFYDRANCIDFSHPEFKCSVMFDTEINFSAQELVSIAKEILKNRIVNQLSIPDKLILEITAPELLSNFDLIFIRIYV